MRWPAVFTAMVTPFDAEGRLATEEAARLAAWLVAHGTGGLVVAGSTGEGATLSDTERERLFRAVREAVPADVPILVGTGTNDTAVSIARSKAAEQWGADGVLAVAPYYNKPPQAGLEAHFVAIAQAIGIPVMLYNVPSRTSVAVEPRTVARIMERAPNVFAVKESGGNVDGFSQLVEQIPGDRLVYSGDDILTLPALAVGAVGVVSVASHVVGDELAAMIAAFGRGDVQTAAALHRRLAPVFRALFVQSNPIPLKWALNRLGASVGDPRLPLVPADETAMRPLAAALEAAGVRPIRY
jgi:4-hydroxy-tetrahydrodipicolinate synthase